MAWIYLMIASLFEIAWTFSLQMMNVNKMRAIRWRDLVNGGAGWMTLAPFAGYVLFGVGNIFFFSLAMKDIPASTALAVWMGSVLIGVKLIEITVLKQTYDLYQFFYMALILAGIVGLKRSAGL
jgi:quaternary ammonium compound-resistance protein SugE